MFFLEKFERFNRLISGWCEWLGVLAVLVMMSITCIDVAGAKIFGTPVLGAIDIVMVAQLVAISLAVAMTFVLGRHVQVEFFVVLLPKRLRAVTDCIVRFLGLALFVIIVWRLFEYGYSLQTGGEVSATARIPIYPFAYCAAVACIPVCLVYLQQFIQSILEVVKNES
ncbi:MAG: TRAP transporter small permease [Pseudomonadota bacterium]